MRTVSQKEIDKQKADGKTVKRTMGGNPVQKKVQKKVETSSAPVQMVPEVNHPVGVRVDVNKELNALVDQHGKTSAVVAQHSDAIKSMLQQIAKISATPERKPGSFNFKIQRNRAGFMENIIATPIK